MKKVVIFDASSLISLAMNGLLEEFKKLKDSFDGYFVIPREVKQEIVDRPLKIKRYELEAMKLQNLIDDKYLVTPKDLGIDEKQIAKGALKFMKIANAMFVGKGQKIKIIQIGEAACLGLSNILTEKKVEHVLAVDERTMRLLVEKPKNLKSLLEHRMHARVRLKESNFKIFKGFRIIRSTELMYIAYKKGLIRWKNKNVLDGLLYALKFKGCAISHDEIEEIKRIKN